jgi:hypothetical protein
MKRNFTGLITLLAGLILSYAIPQAHADWDVFSTNSSVQVGEDFNSGYATGAGSAENAVITNMDVSLSWDINPSTGTAHLYSNVTFAGVWGNPNDSNPWTDMLANDGLHMYSSMSLLQVEFNGEWWEFNQTMNMNVNAWGSLYYNDQHDAMNGWFNTTTVCDGAIPTDVWVYTQIYEGDHPWDTSWQMSVSTEWDIVGGFQLVPSPGALALLGMGGLASRRRRRQ